MAGTSSWLAEPRLYAIHILALVRPGWRMPSHPAHAVEPRTDVEWDSDDRDALIAEGRRQLDRQHTDLDRVRGRAQLVLTTALALGAGLVASLHGAALRGGIAGFLTWTLAAVADLLCLLGAAAVVTVRADIGSIDTANLTHSEAPLSKALAQAYPRAVRDGENTLAARVTVLRDAVLLLLFSAFALAITIWLSLAS